MTDVLWLPGTQKYKAKTENYSAKQQQIFKPYHLDEKESTCQNSPFVKNQSDKHLLQIFKYFQKSTEEKHSLPPPLLKIILLSVDTEKSTDADGEDWELFEEL